MRTGKPFFWQSDALNRRIQFERFRLMKTGTKMTAEALELKQEMRRSVD